MVCKIFVDTSALKAIIDEKDDFYSIAEKIFNKMTEDGCELVTSNFIVDECATLIRVKSGLVKALRFKEFLTDCVPTISIQRVLIKDEIEAWKLFKKEWSGLSFTDCTCFAMMKRMGIKRVFGFDKHFERAGFELEK
jgi:hypothetical protein